MIYFLGGAPRTGKSQLAKKISKATGFSWLSTDNLRESVVNLESIPKSDQLFAHWISWKDEDYIEKTFSPSIQEIINNQKSESKEVVKIVKGFVESISYNNRDFILEGVALLPSFFDTSFIDKYQIKFICVGNTNFESFFEYSWNHRSEGDWLENSNRDIFKKVISYSSKFSELFRNEAKSYNYPYYEINSQTFKSDLDQIVKKLAKY
ncbi:hypothetical protein KKD37_04555 [Patescibacteria group bacterium]|nr:hypothetical protein [Patescibacteria group bacterium]